MGGAKTRLVLALSLGLNVLAVGVIGGASATWLGLGPGRAHHPLRDAAQTLQAADRLRFDATLKAFGRSSRPLRQDARDARKDAARLFVAPVFDAPAVDAALGRARDADLGVRTGLETAVVSFAAGLPQGERTQLAAALAKGGPLRQPVLKPKNSPGPKK